MGRKKPGHPVDDFDGFFLTDVTVLQIRDTAQRTSHEGGLSLSRTGEGPVVGMI